METLLRPTYQGDWFLMDSKIRLVLDDREIKGGTVKSGFDVLIPVGVGAHSLQIKHSIRSQKCDITLPDVGRYLARFKYDRTWGSSSIQLEKLG